MICMLCAFLLTKSLDLSLYYFRSICIICVVIASLVGDGFGEPSSGGEELDQSHFLGLGPRLGQVNAGCCGTIHQEMIEIIFM